MRSFLQETLNGSFEKGRKGKAGNINWFCPALGVIIFEPEFVCHSSILLSAGIHGNETAPVEILDQLVSDIFNQKLILTSRLMILLGNIDALRLGVRYSDYDMNRLFDSKKNEEHYPEILRALLIQQLTVDFYSTALSYPRIHLDLHTAIRLSHHERFGLLPYDEEGLYPESWLNFLSSVDLDALVINHAPSSTYSYFTKAVCQADSVTLELGKALPFGQNDLTRFRGIKEGLYRLVSTNSLGSSGQNRGTDIKVYKVSQILVKSSDDFSLNMKDDVKNFTRFSQGDLLARDGETEFRAAQAEEFIIFPNNHVKNGLRAGLMLIEDCIDTHIR
ncbi:succinylglutamate desuccinylase [Vibrio salinus]|uniref:succinylglutamate desuccinylase n=1 Tax=Vibrio salinus TaxID=2899784 RepID=UPI001E380680|nr:succinylglutamate desuccinylase [Vibrio salinus]MCE0495854.1 succinylglutamate desuccinylase [Vibrio salinus]